ncbi:hypothetical protein HDU98_010143, partial [Podochytrium sp. JEL0797]
MHISITPALSLTLNTNTESNESGTTVWEGGVALARHLAAESNKLKLSLTGKSCIDLGSGTGVVGIVCAQLGANVVLTDIDHPDVLNPLRQNAGQNLIKSGSNATSSQCSVMPLEWSSPAVIPAEIARSAPFDMVVGADVVFSMEAVVKLVDTITALSDRKTDVWIGHEHRDPRVSEHFLQLMKERGFKSKNVKRQNPVAANLAELREQTRSALRNLRESQRDKIFPAAYTKFGTPLSQSPASDPASPHRVALPKQPRPKLARSYLASDKLETGDPVIDMILDSKQPIEPIRGRPTSHTSPKKDRRPRFNASPRLASPSEKQRAADRALSRIEMEQRARRSPSPIFQFHNERLKYTIDEALSKDDAFYRE